MEASNRIKKDLFKSYFPENQEQSHFVGSIVSNSNKVTFEAYGIIRKFMSDPKIDPELKQATCRSIIELGLKNKKNRIAIYALKYIQNGIALKNYYFHAWDYMLAKQGPMYAYKQLYLIQGTEIRIEVAQRVLRKGIQSHSLSQVGEVFKRVQKVLTRTHNVSLRILRDFANLYYKFVKKFTVVCGVKRSATFVVATPISDANSYYSLSILYVINKLIEDPRYRVNVDNLKKLIPYMKDKIAISRALYSIVREQIKNKEFTKAYVTIMEIPFKMSREITSVFLYQHVEGVDQDFDFDEYFEMKEHIESTLKQGAYLESLHPLCFIPQRTLRKWEVSYIKSKIMTSDLTLMGKKSLIKEVSIFMKTFEETVQLQTHQHKHKTHDIQILLAEAHQFLEGKRSLLI